MSKKKVIISASIWSAINELVPYFAMKGFTVKAASFQLVCEWPTHRLYEAVIVTGKHDNGETVPLHSPHIFVSLERNLRGKWEVHNVREGLGDENGFSYANGIDPRNIKGGRELLCDLDELEGVALQSIMVVCPEAMTRIDYRSVRTHPDHWTEDLLYKITFSLRDPGMRNVGSSYIQVTVDEHLSPVKLLMGGERIYSWIKLGNAWIQQDTTGILLD